MIEQPSNDGVLRAHPHALGIEKAVLSSISNNPNLLDECPHLTTDHFYLPQHRIIFDVIRQSITKHGEADLIEMVQTLQSTGLLDRIGGPATFADIYTYHPSGDNFASYVATLGEFRAFRAAIKAGNDMIEAAYSHDVEEVSEAVNAGSAEVLDALTDGDSAKSVKQVLKDSMERFLERASGKTDSMGIPTIGELDNHLRGAHPGRMMIVGAYPEGGKSVIASQILVDAVIAGHPGLFLSLEMPERDIMDRMIIQAARVDAKAFSDPKAYAQENGMDGIAAGTLKAIQRAVQSLKESPLRVQRPANRKIQTVVASIRKAQREIGAKIAVIDYVQLVRGNAGRYDTKEAEVSEISHALQECAQETGVFLMVLSQLNADGETKHGRVIEEDADAVIRIVQDRRKDSETYKEHRHISIDKDRHNGSGGTNVPLILDRAKIRFVHGFPTSNTPDKPEPPRWER